MLEPGSLPHLTAVANVSCDPVAGHETSGLKRNYCAIDDLYKMNAQKQYVARWSAEMLLLQVRDMLKHDGTVAGQKRRETHCLY